MPWEKSDGNIINARISTYIEDLNTVITWSREQNFYTEPFSLLGNSMGGASVIDYARHHQEKVCRLFLISPVIGGKYWEEASLKYDPEEYAVWKSRGWYLYSRNNRSEKVSYGVIEDAKKYDAVKGADDVKARVLIIVGDKDEISLPEHNRLFYERLSTEKRMVEVENGDHVYLDLYLNGKLFDVLKDIIQPELEGFSCGKD